MLLIKYKNYENDDVLGEVTYADISETLIPDFKPEKHDVFVRMVFSSMPSECLWQVVSLEINQNVSEVYLRSMPSPDSLGIFAKKQRKRASNILASRQFNLVEVEFGFQQDVFDGVSRKRNETSSVALMPGEIHKKRPCVVLACEDEKAQVIPLTTSANIGRCHPKKIPISVDSFKSLSKRYTKKESQLLLSMIQTVSVYRIFPMKNQKGNYSHDYAKHKLCAKDKKSLNEALANIYAKSTIDELTNANSSLERLKSEKARILKTYKEVKETVNHLESDNQRYRDTLMKLIESLGDEVVGGEDLIEKAAKLMKS